LAIVPVFVLSITIEAKERGSLVASSKRYPQTSILVSGILTIICRFDIFLKSSRVKSLSEDKIVSIGVLSINWFGGIISSCCDIFDSQ